MKEEKKLKLYLWEGALSDYTDGIMGALAPDLKTAKKLLKELDKNTESEFNEKHKVITKPYAFRAYGGG